MSKQRQFASVWDAIEDTPRQAASMRARSELLMALQEWVKFKNKTQVEAAKILGVTHPACPIWHAAAFTCFLSMS